MRFAFRRLTMEIDLVPAGITTFLILVGVGVMNYLSQRSTPPGSSIGAAQQPNARPLPGELPSPPERFAGASVGQAASQP